PAALPIDAPVADCVAGAGRQAVRVRTDRASELAELLARSGATIASEQAGVLEISGLEAGDIAASAVAAGIVLSELTPLTTSLEDAYMALTDDAVEYRTSAVPAGVAR